MLKFRFRDFKVYRDSITFRMAVKDLVKNNFPSEEKYILTDQIIRAANSIVLNIAEGSDRSTDKDFALFLNRLHTSLNEVVACFDIALNENYITSDEYDLMIVNASVLGNQLTAFRRKLMTNPSK